MKLNHIKLDQVDSTQEFLKNLEINTNDQALVSTRIQSAGQGRKGRSWTQFSQTICFSFTLPKRENITISSAEMSCYVFKFLEERYHFQNGCLKWPNDILNEDYQKIAGILIDVIKNRLVVGVGINLGGVTANNNIDAASIVENFHMDEEDFHNIPYEIVNYIFSQYPQKTNEIVKIWNSNCAYKNRNVVITDDNNQAKGIFKGIGGFGEALLFNEEQRLETVFSGTLRLAQDS